MDRAVQEALKGKQEDTTVAFPSKISLNEYKKRIVICLDLLRDWDTDEPARKRVEARWGKDLLNGCRRPLQRTGMNY